jgi:anhydro-N-acetylmuramic acid kinase
MYWLGVMSGTSLDGVDVVAAEIENKVLVKGHVYHPFSAELMFQLRTLQSPQQNELHLSRVVTLSLMDIYINAIKELMARHRIARSQIRAIGVHGQTIRHQPHLGYTIQICDPAYLAEKLEMDIICDFRSRDIAAGGQGAPLVPAFHQSVFTHKDTRRGILNLGGIANLTVLSPLHLKEPVLGYDVGPCHVLLNDWTVEHLQQPFDDQGLWARSGEINFALLETLRQEPYLAKHIPKSTGRDDFHLSWLREQLKKSSLLDESPQNVMRTLVEWMAEFNVAEFAKHQLQEVYVCGGGVFNLLLMDRLKSLAAEKQINVCTTDVLGVPPMQVEALAFAWLAKQFIDRKPANLPEVTGAKGSRILGALYPA